MSTIWHIHNMRRWHARITYVWKMAYLIPFKNYRYRILLIFIYIFLRENSILILETNVWVTTSAIYHNNYHDPKSKRTPIYAKFQEYFLQGDWEIWKIPHHWFFYRLHFFLRIKNPIHLYSRTSITRTSTSRISDSSNFFSLQPIRVIEVPL